MESEQVPDVATVILAKDEEGTIAEAVTGARRFCTRVVVMDGHSRDATAEVARESGAEVHLDPGSGKGAAIRESLRLVPEPVVVFMDADGSHDPADIPRLTAPVLDGSADLCIGSRFTGGSEELSITVGQLVRTIGNISMNIAINKRWGVELTDTLNGYRAVRREALAEVGLREDIHTIEQEMVMKLLRSGYRVVNIATHEYPRRYGESHIKISRQWPRFVLCVLAHVAKPSRHSGQPPRSRDSR